MSKRKLAILGSTGSIGTQTLEVVEQYPDHFSITVLSAGRNADLLIQQALKFKPAAVVVCEKAAFEKVRDTLQGKGIEVLFGEDALVETVQRDDIDIVLTAVVGAVGLRPTVAAIESGKDIALANKETLVVAGELITGLVEKHQVKLLPVDSEHSAIFQCLAGEEANPIEKIILTASGGPFRGKSIEDLKSVTKAQALKHPNWTMGAKITIDSASLMNKGLEVIEAKWLFGLEYDQIDVIIHPQSIIHSLVQFEDGSLKAQMGLPDMKLPIQYALTYPKRFENNFKRFNFLDYPNLTFEQPDMEVFRNLKLAFQALEAGGNAACVLNGANEIVVEAFLNDRVGFLQMSEIIEETLCQVKSQKTLSLEDYLQFDLESRTVARSLIERI
ncbi:1-deoxy-D-xylulose 5-phosphate reductoisomerase [Sphingobacterium mizutaii NBRC 14946 = DSM 11724]|uniref:1-deoxy-D-xylulose 5-phosphate reductoisomerase n=2 Tax=Sphingobacterium mizutaii TaxID=1010 RepID=A0AAJ5BZP6_9SPHI|nr:1-deoxy-D-xylulose-5-phosphate reductoisomerase [Sphingobacterium mizutaii]GEM69280.1 1-deoxy-D-xylulose 5-phosphate reductoisomerase [Sphingobacterium mizutaii NBRC 14946 = DSM 11724]SDL42772.1 1-deoxy-D-xylulose 5-phosphate reductoisomerase [Sphingobacterium mizutaii]SNV45234.1 1-deoxy-D-xylulose 5-phosphate reductoisomerase [Sphingobacterium mizutaii]